MDHQVFTDASVHHVVNINVCVSACVRPLCHCSLFVNGHIMVPCPECHIFYFFQWSAPWMFSRLFPPSLLLLFFWKKESLWVIHCLVWVVLGMQLENCVMCLLLTKRAQVFKKKSLLSKLHSKASGKPFKIGNIWISSSTYFLNNSVAGQ